VRRADPLVVDKRPVGRAGILDKIACALPGQLGVPAGHLGVADDDDIAYLAADADLGRL